LRKTEPIAGVARVEKQMEEKAQLYDVLENWLAQ
jgi:hypothetical protein